MSEKQTNTDIEPIGWVRAPFNEKFAVPRQPSLAPSVKSQIQVQPPYGVPEAFAGLEEFSHIWIWFRFHQNLDRGWKAQVRPPRLGGNKKIGVFATRSSFRPNGFGMSVVPLLGINAEKDGVILIVSGLDLVDGTPVYDIKPYVPYVDAIPEANGAFAGASPELITVRFSIEAETQLQTLCNNPQLLRAQVTEILAQDPRPAYRKQAKTDPNHYGTAFADMNFRWQVVEQEIVVTEVIKR